MIYGFILFFVTGPMAKYSLKLFPKQKNPTFIRTKNSKLRLLPKKLTFPTPPKNRSDWSFHPCIHSNCCTVLISVLWILQSWEKCLDAIQLPIIQLLEKLGFLIPFSFWFWQIFYFNFCPLHLICETGTFTNHSLKGS